ncbi:MAG: glycine--tRNA ligase subunit beta [Proteobacteria bacterium]|nr:glycine--tRNA ligase subunit beta [Desulfobacula sp.]MBU4129367.1 glycine--tRNA ligase subunit beta [Pseudomonadota bacterium]
MNTLLIEIGCEEIPAGYIVPALTAFKANILDALTKARINHGEAKILGTPKRLVLMVANVADTQNPFTSTVSGPPERVGFDEKGAPTLAARKFAEKAGIRVEDIILADTDKGRYLTAVVKETCEPSLAILEQMMPKQILDMPFPKSMRWGSLSISFARPIISLVGMLGGQVLHFSVGNIHASNQIFGHRFMHPQPLTIERADDYEALMASANVIVDIDKRKQMLTDAIQALAKQHGSHVLEDPALVDIVANLVEYPYPVVGRFDDQFLGVPDEVLITAMREHQKYFALVDENKKLKPLFIAVNNTLAKDMDLVARGHEKVLRARLSDAKFFYEADCESSLDAFTEKLKKVTFQAQLGSVYEKTQRIGVLAAYLADASAYADKESLKTKVARAAMICKSDLVSQVVIEFTKLQGFIGRAYAIKGGENADVADAIEQHYRPVQSGGDLPENPTAALLAIADKLDTICGCFSLGLIPTGGADPYALRRLGIGILQILQAENLVLSLAGLIEIGVAGFVTDIAKKNVISAQVKEFLQNRMVNIMTDRGFSKEAVNSALAASFDNIPDVQLRVKALDSLRQAPDFEPLAITFKRVENIQKKAGELAARDVNTALFEYPAETNLFEACTKVASMVEALIEKGNYDGALKEIATLRPLVDKLFDDVMVFADDEAVKNNRMALLASVSGLFKNIADFSMI